MKKFRVTYSLGFEIIAENEESAIELASEQLNGVVNEYGIEYDYFDINIDELSMNKEEIKEYEEKRLTSNLELKEKIFKEQFLSFINNSKEKIDKFNNYFLITYIYDYINLNSHKLFMIYNSENISNIVLLAALIENAFNYYGLDISRITIKNILKSDYEINDVLKIIFNL